ncbi:MAG: PAS domain S-box protein [Sulfitobacter sp.]
MFNTLSVAQLESLLNHFTVPMFVIETEGLSSAFQITGLNTAMEELSGVQRQDMVGRSIEEIAAEKAVKDTMEYYQQCVLTGQTIRFDFLFSKDQEESRWDQILQYTRSPEGYHRVIATAIKVPNERVAFEDRLAFEDVRYFSSIADLQLENLCSAFSNATTEARVTPMDEDRIMRLHAVCRTVQRTVGDIKQVVRAAQARQFASQKQALNLNFVDVDHRYSRQGMGIVRALVDACSEDQDIQRVSKN